MTAHAITLGIGRDRPQGRKVELSSDPISSLGRTIREHVGDDAWWSGSIFDGNYRLGKKWNAASAIPLDVDYHDAQGDHAPIPDDVAVRAIEALGELPNLIHCTPRGLRVALVLVSPVLDKIKFRRAARGAAHLVEQALGDLLRDHEGLKVDPTVTEDVARFLFTPSARVGGQQRAAEVMVVRPEAWDVGELERHDPEDLRRAARQFHASTGDWNGVRQEILRRFSVRDALARLGTTVNGEGNFPCPLHPPDDNPSAWIWEAPDGTGFFVCAHGRRGVEVGVETQGGKLLADAIALEAWRRRIQLGQATAVLARELNIPIPTSGRPGSQINGGFGHFSHASKPNWISPRPLEEWIPPKFPVNALPVALARFVEATAIATQTPQDLAGMCSLGTLSAAVGKKYVIEPMPGWREPLNLYITTILPPAERKSAVHRMASEPLIEYEKTHRKEWSEKFNLALSERRILVAELKNAEKKAAKPGKDQATARERVEELTVKLAETPEPIYPRLLADDATSEAIVSLLAQQRGRLAVFSAEGTLLSILAGRYSDSAPSIEAILKAHAGDPMFVDRITRPPERIESPCLTLCLAIQPDVLAVARANETFVRRGLLARILYAIPRSQVGFREMTPPPVSSDVRESYFTRIRAILDLEDDIGADGEVIPRILRLTPQAAQLLTEYRTTLENRLAPETGDLAPIGYWAGKLAGAIARIAGLLHVGENASIFAVGQIPDTIDVDTIKKALSFSEYLIEHARAAHGLIFHTEIREAERILKWIWREKKTTFKRSQAWRHLRGHLQSASEMDEPLAILEDHGYIQRADLPTGPGRPPEEYFVNPKIHGQNGQNSSHEGPSSEEGVTP